MSLAHRIIAFAGKMDLGRKYETCGPASLVSNRGSVDYPAVWVDEKPEPIDLPDSGKAVVNYKVVRRGTDERNGKKTHSATIEIHSIEPIADKIKKFAASLEFRERNADGEFAPQTEGGPDPVAMARAYGPQTISGGGKAAVAGLGLAGAGLAAAALSRRKFRRVSPA